MANRGQETRVIPSPFTLTQNTSGVTHSDWGTVDTATTAGQNEKIVSYQVPKGIALVFGGSKDGQKFYYHAPANGAGTAVEGTLSIYKVSPDNEFLKILIGQYHSRHTKHGGSGTTGFKDDVVDVGKEVARTIREDEYIEIYFAPDAAGMPYIATATYFNLDLTKLTSITL